jgi:hypothetical protein
MFAAMIPKPSGASTARCSPRFLALSLGFTLAGAAAAQTTATERHFDVLHTLDGRAFTNAVVSSSTPAYLIVLHDGGGQKVYFTNLDDKIRAQYGYDADKAEAFASKDAEKKKQIREALDKQTQAALEAENAVGEARKVEVLRVLGNYKYHIRSDDGEADVVFLAMPGSVAEFLGQESAVDADEAAASAQDAAASKGAGKPARGSRRLANYTASAGAQANATSTQQAQAKSAHAADAAAKSAAHDLAAQRAEKTTILAGPTGSELFGLRVWRFIGFPAKPAPAKGTTEKKGQ